MIFVPLVAPDLPKVNNLRYSICTSNHPSGSENYRDLKGSRMCLSAFVQCLSCN